jgi:hypothetical protein
VKELPVDLKTLDPTRKVDPLILLIAHRGKGKGAIICPDICTKAAAAGVVACKEGI